jgi:predicted RNA-binding Zn-ribbon protein involved in translation (DUF1610 family)
MKQIFLSRPNWLPENVEDGIKNFYNLLKSNQLNPRTIGQSDYPNESPLDEVIKLMVKCEGTIVLGVPQLLFKEGTIKGSAINEGFYLGTEWNHIEAALAHSLGQPLLIIHDESVSRGIFDRGASNSFLHSVDMTDKSWPISDSISGALSNWKEKLSGTNFGKHSKASDNATKPTLKWGMYKFENEEGLFCPVCYEKDGLKIPCSRVNSNYYQCPNCNAKLS